jgi:putative Mg2+ transporter-C (MgtC) family protein
MLVTVYEAHWMPTVGDSIRLDPTRMAQGIMTGIGFNFPMALAVVLTVGLLSAFRSIQSRMPTQADCRFEVRCRIGDLSDRLYTEAQFRRYSMTIASAHRDGAARLASRLESADFVRDVRIAPSGN